MHLAKGSCQTSRLPLWSCSTSAARHAATAYPARATHRFCRICVAGAAQRAWCALRVVGAAEDRDGIALEIFPCIKLDQQGHLLQSPTPQLNSTGRSYLAPTDPDGRQWRSSTAACAPCLTRQQRDAVKNAARVDRSRCFEMPNQSPTIHLPPNGLQQAQALYKRPISAA